MNASKDRGDHSEPDTGSNHLLCREYCLLFRLHRTLPNIGPYFLPPNPRLFGIAAGFGVNALAIDRTFLLVFA